MSRSRDRTGAPLSARSVVASTLLGTHPPTLPGRLLVALATRFDIAPGTTRVALSRMVDKGELANDDGTYTLAGPLLERQRRQDRSLDPATRPWDGRWELAIAVESADASQRAARRASLQALKLAPLRDGVWARPANLDPDRLATEPAWTDDDLQWGIVDFGTDDAALAGRMWDLDGWACRARELLASLEGSTDLLRADDDAALAPGFELSAATLRHLLADPELPAEVLPDDWPTGTLRAAYASFDDAYRGLLRRFFRAHR